jgi:predicted amidohydrolase YtcJ
VYPAFTDSHTHVASVALGKERIRLDECSSLSEALKNISEYITSHEDLSWVVGGGWNANRWSDGIPCKEHLDKITTDHPVALYNKDGHTQWLNSKALALAGFFDLNNDPPGGKLGRDSDNNLTGLVYEKACDIVNIQSETNSYGQLKRCMDKLYPELYALGLTSVHSCESLEIWSIFQRMASQKDLKIRVCMHPPIEDADFLIDSGLRSGFGNDWLRLGGLKYFVDGSLGSQTAELYENYTGYDHSGIEVLTESELTDLLYKTTDKGFSATIHAIGDKANHKTLNALQKVKDVSLKSGLRHRIEHAQILIDEDVPRFFEQKVIASMQPLHISDDVKISDKYLGRRASTAYRMSGLLNSGARVVFGSDMPIAEPDPLKGILAAHSRRYLLDKNEPRWNESECIPVVNALRCYTKDAAYASNEENLKGTLEIGKLADFIGLSVDIEKADEDALREARVNLTVLAGDVVFERKN